MASQQGHMWGLAVYWELHMCHNGPGAQFTLSILLYSLGSGAREIKELPQHHIARKW